MSNSHQQYIQGILDSTPERSVHNKPQGKIDQKQIPEVPTLDSEGDRCYPLGSSLSSHSSSLIPESLYNNSQSLVRDSLSPFTVSPGPKSS